MPHFVLIPAGLTLAKAALSRLTGFKNILNTISGKEHDRETQLLLKDRQEQMELTQMKVRCLQQQESQRSQLELQNNNQKFQLDIQASNQEFDTLQQRRNHDFQLDLARFNTDSQRELQEFIQECHLRSQKDSHAFLAWKWEQEKSLQQDLAEYTRETQLIVAICNRQTSMQLMEEKYALDNWPLNLTASQIAINLSDRLPLSVLIIPPDVNYDKFANLSNDDNKRKLHSVEERLCGGLGKFVSDYYSPSHHPQRAINLLDYAWDSRKYRGGASIQALYSKLHSESILILQSVVDGDCLSFEYTFWSNGSDRISQTIFSKYKFVDMLFDSAKKRAKDWKKTRDRLIERGQNPSKYNKILTHNLELLEEEESYAEDDEIDVSKLQFPYVFTSEDHEVATEWLVQYHSLILALCTDIHYLGQANITPLLPQLLPELFSTEIDPKIMELVMTSYEQTIDSFASERSTLIPDLYLDLAHNFQYLSDRTYMRRCLIKSFQALFRLRQESSGLIADDLDVCLLDLKNYLTTSDLDYVSKLNTCLDILNINSRFDLASICLQRGVDCIKQGKYSSAISEFNLIIEMNSMLAPVYFHRGFAYSKLEQYLAAINDFTYHLELAPNSPNTYISRGNIYYERGEYQLAIIDFDLALSLDPESNTALNGKKLVCEAIERASREQAINTYISQGNSEYEQGKYQLAIVNFDYALNLDPNNAIALNRKNLVCKEIYRAEAEEEAVDTYISQGKRKYKQGEYQLAIIDLDRALNLDLNNATALHWKNLACQEIDRAVKKQQEKEQAISNYISKGNAYSQREEYQLALQNYESALRLNPNNTAALQGKDLTCRVLKEQQEKEQDINNHISEGNAYSERGEYQLAIQSYEAALILDPNSAVARQMLATKNIKKEHEKQKISRFIKEFPEPLVPVTIVTGLLGSGKTTFINEVLENIHREDIKVACIVGEFGETSINNDLIITRSEHVVELSCYCDYCKNDITEDLVNSVHKVLARSEEISYLVVESEGMADPLPIALTFLGTELRDLTRLDSIITIIDAYNFSIDLLNNEAVQNQINYGDIIILNKFDSVDEAYIDLFDEADVDLLEVRIRDMKEGARIIRSSYGKVPLALILGLNLFEAEEHFHLDGESENNLVFFESDKPFALKKFQDFLDNQLTDNIFRAKGILWFEESKISHVFHLSGKRFNCDDAEWKDRPQTQLLIIGQDLDREKLIKQLEYIQI
jgi:G3E family GTPase/tetratricopeptide (TPR) repeat protein